MDVQAAAAEEGRHEGVVAPLLMLVNGDGPEGMAVRAPRYHPTFPGRRISSSTNGEFDRVRGVRVGPTMEQAAAMGPSSTAAASQRGSIELLVDVHNTSGGGRTPIACNETLLMLSAAHGDRIDGFGGKSRDGGGGGGGADDELDDGVFCVPVDRTASMRPFDETKPTADADAGPSTSSGPRKRQAQPATKGKLGPFACPHCPVRFKEERVLRRHLVRKHGVEKRPKGKPPIYRTEEQKRAAALVRMREYRSRKRQKIQEANAAELLSTFFNTVKPDTEHGGNDADDATTSDSEHEATEEGGKVRAHKNGTRYKKGERTSTPVMRVARPVRPGQAAIPLRSSTRMTTRLARGKAHKWEADNAPGTLRGAMARRAGRDDVVGTGGHRHEGVPERRSVGTNGGGAQLIAKQPQLQKKAVRTRRRDVTRDGTRGKTRKRPSTTKRTLTCGELEEDDDAEIDDAGGDAAEKDGTSHSTTMTWESDGGSSDAEVDQKAQ